MLQNVAALVAFAKTGHVLRREENNVEFFEEQFMMKNFHLLTKRNLLFRLNFLNNLYNE